MTSTYDYDVITDEPLDFEPQYDWETDELEDDDEPVTGYAFVRETIEDEDNISQNSKIVVSDYLPDVLRAFEDFLRDAGFTYVRSLGAECGDNGDMTWSSAD